MRAARATSASSALSEYDARALTASRALAELFEAAVAASPEPGRKRKPIANWLLRDVQRVFHDRELEIERGAITPLRARRPRRCGPRG